MRLVVFAVAIILSACGGATTVDGDDVAAPSGVYASSCDSLATIDFQADGIAVVNRNFCEGYAEETMSYVIDGDVLRLGGRPDDPNSGDQFSISDGVLTLTSDTAFISCGTCRAGDTWEQQ